MSERREKLGAVEEVVVEEVVVEEVVVEEVVVEEGGERRR